MVDQTAFVDKNSEIDERHLQGPFTVIHGIAYPQVKDGEAVATAYQINKWRNKSSMSREEMVEAMESDAMKIRKKELHSMERVPIRSEHFRDLELGFITESWLGNNNELEFSAIITDIGARKSVAVKDPKRRPYLSIKYDKTFDGVTGRANGFKPEEVTFTRNPRYRDCVITMVASNDDEEEEESQYNTPLQRIVLSSYTDWLLYNDREKEPSLQE